MKILDFFRKNIAIDLGTANTLIIHNGEVVLNEPSIIAVERLTNKILAVGREAMNMHEKTHENIRTIKPLKDGVIADFHAAEQMIRGMVKMISTAHLGLFHSIVNKMVVCVPSEVTDVEMRAVRDSAEHAGGKDVYIITEPIAAAIGIGIDIQAPIGSMIVDIGGGTTDVAVISLSGIVCNKSIKVAGDVFNSNIIEYVKAKYNVLIGERTAENLKINVGAVIKNFENAPENISFLGRDWVSGRPKTITVSHEDMAEALDDSIGKIEIAILHTLEVAPPELSADIYKNGIFLTGGGALLKGLDARIAAKTGLNVHVSEDPLKAVVHGSAIVLKNLEHYKTILIDR